MVEYLFHDIHLDVLVHKSNILTMPILPILFKPFGLHSLQRLLNYLAFQFLHYKCTWWRLFQKRVICTKLERTTTCMSIIYYTFFGYDIDILYLWRYLYITTMKEYKLTVPAVSGPPLNIVQHIRTTSASIFLMSGNISACNGLVQANMPYVYN